MAWVPVMRSLRPFVADPSLCEGCLSLDGSSVAGCAATRTERRRAGLCRSMRVTCWWN